MATKYPFTLIQQTRSLLKNSLRIPHRLSTLCHHCRFFKPRAAEKKRNPREMMFVVQEKKPSIAQTRLLTIFFPEDSLERVEGLSSSSIHGCTTIYR